MTKTFNEMFGKGKLDEASRALPPGFKNKGWNRSGSKDVPGPRGVSIKDYKKKPDADKNKDGDFKTNVDQDGKEVHEGLVAKAAGVAARLAVGPQFGEIAQGAAEYAANKGQAYLSSKLKSVGHSVKKAAKLIDKFKKEETQMDLKQFVEATKKRKFDTTDDTPLPDAPKVAKLQKTGKNGVKSEETELDEATQQSDWHHREGFHQHNADAVNAHEKMKLHSNQESAANQVGDKVAAEHHGNLRGLYRQAASSHLKMAAHHARCLGMKKNVSEEFDTNAEMLDELEKKTLKSYQRKATTSAQRAWDKADKEEDKGMSTDGNKYPEKQARHQANANAAIKTWKKREKGLKMVDKKLKKEEVGQIDEISRKTLGSYVKKAAKEVDDYAYRSGHVTGRSGEKENYQNNRARKRVKGIGKAADRLAKEETNPVISEKTKDIYAAMKARQASKAADKAKTPDEKAAHSKKSDEYKKQINREEVEQIDEISQKLARSYAVKSAEHQVDMNTSAVHMDNSDDKTKARPGFDKLRDKLDKVSARRTKGLNMANKRTGGVKISPKF